MLPLTDLTNDVLLSILSYLFNDRPALYALAASSRCFYDSTLQYIYRDVKLWVRYSNILASFSKEFEHFQRTINERPTIAPLVQKLHLTWFRGQSRTKNAAESGFRVNKLLAKVSRLRELDLTAFGMLNLRFEPKFLEQNGLECLRKIRIKDRMMQVDDVVRYLRMKNLETMCIADMDTQSSMSENLRYPSRHAQHNPPSSLTTLSLGPFHPPKRMLLELLRLISNLKDLSCWVPGDGGASNHDAAYGRIMSSVLSPADIPIALKPIQHSLLRLELKDGTQTEWLNHDGSHMNMSSFNCLKVLKARAECFFAVKAPTGKRNGIYKLLPSSLEGLHFDFGFGWNFLFDASIRSEWERFEASGQNVCDTTYAWLEEIAEYKTLYPSLNLVTLTEQIRHPRPFMFDRILWDIPTRLDAVFKAAELDLKVWLRRPKKGR